MDYIPNDQMDFILSLYTKSAKLVQLLKFNQCNAPY